MLEGKKFEKVTAIFFKEGVIVCGVVRNNLMTIDSWLKMLLETLFDRGRGVNSLGCRGMAVGAKPIVVSGVFLDVLV